MWLQECGSKPLEGLDTQRLVISRPFMVYGDAEEIVRYATTNKMSPAAGEFNTLSMGILQFVKLIMSS